LIAIVTPEKGYSESNASPQRFAWNRAAAFIDRTVFSRSLPVIIPLPTRGWQKIVRSYSDRLIGFAATNPARDNRES